jgi:hypothetical protein
MIILFFLYFLFLFRFFLSIYPRGNHLCNILPARDVTNERSINNKNYAIHRIQCLQNKKKKKNVHQARVC